MMRATLRSRSCRARRRRAVRRACVLLALVVVTSLLESTRALSCEGDAESSAHPDSDDPFRVLGVPRDASESDIRRAYRVRSRCFHPDKAAPDDPLARERFLRVSKAYELLSDSKRREQYARSGSAADNGFRFDDKIDLESAEQMFRVFMNEFDEMFKQEDFIAWVHQAADALFETVGSVSNKASSAKKQLSLFQRAQKALLTRTLIWLGPRVWDWFRTGVEQNLKNGNVQFQQRFDDVRSQPTKPQPEARRRSYSQRRQHHETSWESNPRDRPQPNARNTRKRERERDL